MAEENHDPVPKGLVCPRCGSPATGSEYCGTCGLHLAEQDELPTRERWEQRPGKWSQSPDPGSPRGAGPSPSLATWRARWTALPSRWRAGALAVSALLLVLAVTVIATSGGGDDNTSSATDEADQIITDAGLNPNGLGWEYIATCEQLMSHPRMPYLAGVAASGEVNLPEGQQASAEAVAAGIEELCASSDPTYRPVNEVGTQVQQGG